VGYVIDFSRDVGGWGGLGLGLEGRSLCQVVIAAGKLLVIDGSSFGIPRREFPITPQVQRASREEGGRYGVTIRIEPKEAEIHVRAGKPGRIAAMTISVAIDAAQHDRLVTGHMAVIARDGRPAITPFIDEAREAEPDLALAAPPNRWRFAGERELYGLYRAAWRLKERTPASLERLRKTMVDAVDKGPVAQRAAMDSYRRNLESVLRDLRQIPDTAAATAALAEIPGDRNGA
jgi:hypothetical protein